MLQQSEAIEILDLGLTLAFRHGFHERDPCE